MNRHASLAIAQGNCAPGLTIAANRALSHILVLGRHLSAEMSTEMRLLWSRLRTRRADRLRDAGHARKELEIRRLEESYARATDVQDIERMERDWGRRDAGGLRDWR